MQAFLVSCGLPERLVSVLHSEGAGELRARSRLVISLRCDALPKHSSKIPRLAHLSEELLDVVVSLG